MSSSQSPVQKAWSSVVRHAKEHHASVQAATDALYPSRYPQPASKSPVSSASSASSAQERSSLDKAWARVKQHAKEHHESVNAAYAAYYGVRR